MPPRYGMSRCRYHYCSNLLLLLLLLICKNENDISSVGAQESPYMMEKVPQDGEELTGNARYQGYCADLAWKIAELVGFSYELRGRPRTSPGTEHERH